MHQILGLKRSSRICSSEYEDEKNDSSSREDTDKLTTLCLPNMGSISLCFLKRCQISSLTNAIITPCECQNRFRPTPNVLNLHIPSAPFPSFPLHPMYESLLFPAHNGKSTNQEGWEVYMLWKSNKVRSWACSTTRFGFS